MAGKPKKYYFLQMEDNFFRIKDIKKLRQLPKGDTYLIVYMKIMLSSLKDNGTLHYDDLEEDIASELALQIEEPLEDVQATLDYLFKRGIIQKNSPSEYEIVTVPEMVGSEGDSARRMREWRKKQKASQSDDSLSLCDHLVTAPQKTCDADIEKEIKRKEIQRDIRTPERGEDHGTNQNNNDSRNRDQSESIPGITKL